MAKFFGIQGGRAISVHLSLDGEKLWWDYPVQPDSKEKWDPSHPHAGEILFEIAREAISAHPGCKVLAVSIS